jgi:hypothetical protein
VVRCRGLHAQIFNRDQVSLVDSRLGGVRAASGSHCVIREPWVEREASRGQSR